MRAVVNAAADAEAVPPPDDAAGPFHRGLAGYAPTPVHRLDRLAAELGLAAVQIKDESDRLGLPAFKILGAAWAIERALRERPDVHTLVAASAGNHGRAVAHAAALRGRACRVFLPARARAARRRAIAAEGAGLDCAEVSPAAWPSLLRGIAGTIAVGDDEAAAGMDELASYGLAIGECGAAAPAALRALLSDGACRELRERLGVTPQTRVLLIGTEGHTGADTG